MQCRRIAKGNRTRSKEWREGGKERERERERVRNEWSAKKRTRSIETNQANAGKKQSEMG
jgi:hypothetical protein